MATAQIFAHPSANEDNFSSGRSTATTKKAIYQSITWLAAGRISAPHNGDSTVPLPFLPPSLPQPFNHLLPPPSLWYRFMSSWVSCLQADRHWLIYYGPTHSITDEHWNGVIRDGGRNAFRRYRTELKGGSAEQELLTPFLINAARREEGGGGWLTGRESSEIANHRATSSNNIYRCSLVDCHAGGTSGLSGLARQSIILHSWRGELEPRSLASTDAALFHICCWCCSSAPPLHRIFGLCEKKNLQLW